MPSAPRSPASRSPTAALAREATEFVQDVSTQLLFDHSRRVFLWASLQGEQIALDYDPELLYVGAMFHDVGLVEGHRSEHERFEIDGANAARAFLERHGLPEEQVMTVWESIALHTTPEIPRYKQPEVRLVTLGVEYDVLGMHFDALTDAAARGGPRRAPADGLQVGHHRGLLGGHARQARHHVRHDEHRRPRGHRARLRAAELLRHDPQLAVRDMIAASSERKLDDSVARAVAGGGLSGIALIHVLQLPDAFAATTYLGLLFIGAAVGCLVLAALLARTGDPRVWAAAGALPTLVLVGYVISRTVGLPGFTGDIGEWSEPLGLASMAFEGLVICVSVAVLDAIRH